MALGVPFAASVNRYSVVLQPAGAVSATTNVWPSPVATLVRSVRGNGRLIRGFAVRGSGAGRRPAAGGHVRAEAGGHVRAEAGEVSLIACHHGAPLSRWARVRLAPAAGRDRPLLCGWCREQPGCVRNFLPPSWAVHVDKWLPFNAGGAIWQNVSAPSMFSPWTGFALFCGYAAIALIGGLILFRRRDA